MIDKTKFVTIPIYADFINAYASLIPEFLFCHEIETCIVNYNQSDMVNTFINDYSKTKPLIKTSYGFDIRSCRASMLFISTIPYRMQKIGITKYKLEKTLKHVPLKYNVDYDNILYTLHIEQEHDRIAFEMFMHYFIA